MGNTVVVVPSEAHPLSATDFYQVLDTSDVPGGVVNIVTGPTRRRWPRCWPSTTTWTPSGTSAPPRAASMVEYASAGNMKRTWVNYGHARDWLDKVQGEGEEFLREATQVKNIWTPYGE